MLSSAALWSAAFGLYAVRYWPALTRPGWTASQGDGDGLCRPQGALHQTAVVLSLTGFLRTRAGLLRRCALGDEAAWRGTLPHVVDTVLLLSALALAWMLRLSPGAAPWLAAKIGGLLLYIALGMLALRPGRPLALRATGLVGRAAHLRLDPPRWP